MSALAEMEELIVSGPRRFSSGKGAGRIGGRRRVMTEKLWNEPPDAENGLHASR
jgi:hypothetical protein